MINKNIVSLNCKVSIMKTITLCMIEYSPMIETIEHLEKFGWRKVGELKDIRHEVYPQGNTKDNQLLTMTLVKENI